MPLAGHEDAIGSDRWHVRSRGTAPALPAQVPMPATTRQRATPSPNPAMAPPTFHTPTLHHMPTWSSSISYKSSSRQTGNNKGNKHEHRQEVMNEKARTPPK